MMNDELTRELEQLERELAQIAAIVRELERVLAYQCQPERARDEIGDTGTATNQNRSETV